MIASCQWQTERSSNNPKYLIAFCQKSGKVTVLHLHTGCKIVMWSRCKAMMVRQHLTVYFPLLFSEGSAGKEEAAAASQCQDKAAGSASEAEGGGPGQFEPLRQVSHGAGLL